MPYFAGIDEAGYGPLFGPLVVSATVFKLRDRAQQDQLWNFTKKTLGRTVAESKTKPMVADSKVVARGKHGFVRLEETACTFLSMLNGLAPRTVAALMETLGSVPAKNCPWYDAPLDLPRKAWTNVATRWGKAVALDLAAHGVELAAVRSSVMHAGTFNVLIEKHDNKSLAEWEAVGALLSELFKKFGKDGLVVRVDRLGGRARYGRLLYETFKGYNLKILEQSDDKSAYRLSGRDREMEVSFETGADDRYFPTALASVFSKYLRELHMEDLNGFFAKKVRNLKPTAGYVQDGKRFLAEIESVIESENLPRNLLVRCR